jgi:hypothetical protein
MPCKARISSRGTKYWIVRKKGGGVRKTYTKPKKTYL